MDTVDSHDCQVRNLYRREGKAGKWVVFGRICVECGKWHQGGPAVDSGEETVDSKPEKTVDSTPKPSTVVSKTVDSVPTKTVDSKPACLCPPDMVKKGKHLRLCYLGGKG